MAYEYEETSFEADPFAEGRFRYAYKGEWMAPPSKANQSCVVKKFKDTYTWERTGWDTTVKIYSRAKELAQVFGRGLEFTDCSVHKITESSDKPRGPRLNEFVVVEDYLEGTYKKWCNNYGSVSPEARGVDHDLPAFMHWSWIRSKGQEMVGDLQGVKKPGGGYKLTDPAIMSISHEYGVTDTGIEGMAMFFLIHGCSPACQGLPKPMLAQFVGQIPDFVLQRALAFQQLSRSGNTTYTHETVFNQAVKTALIPAFTAIAQGRA